MANISKRRNQIIATIVVSITMFCMGTGMTWSSPAIPDIEHTEVFGVLSSDQKSWIASLVTVGALLCGPISAYTVDKFGRRMSLMVLTLPMAIGWLLISFSYVIGIGAIYAGRFLTGLAIGGNSHIVVVYVSEIAQQKIRGALMSILALSMSLGFIFTYTLGTFASWFVLSITNTSFPILLLIGMYFIPESPTHLLNKEKKREAGKALMWLRGARNFEQIQHELNEMMENIEEALDENEGVLKSLRSRDSLKALGISMGLMMCQQLSGINAVLFFTLSIFQAAGTSIDANLSSIIVGCVFLISVLFNSALIDRMGRRMLMIMSEVGMATALFALGAFFHLKKANDGVAPNGLGFLPLASLMVFIVMYMIGAGPIPWLMMGELLPRNIKGFGCGLATSFNWLMAFLVTKLFVSFNEILEIYGCYYLFGGLCLVSGVFSLLFVPETKGKSLDEIQKLYFSRR